MADDVNQTTSSASNPVIDPVLDPSIDPAIDPATNSPANPVSDKSVGANTQKNPLDVLEDLLKDIDGGKVKSNTKKTPDFPEEPKGPSPEEIAQKKLEEEMEQKRIEFEKKKAEQLVIDQQLIEQQRLALEQEMLNGSANIARTSQDEEKKVEFEEKKQAEEGFEILQIDHTKI